jgi:hypothetical protein
LSTADEDDDDDDDEMLLVSECDVVNKVKIRKLMFI